METLHHVFDAPWRSVALASWLKYPNPLRPDVLGLDMVDRYFDYETQTLTAYRVSLIKGVVPSWVCAVTGGCMCLFLEHSVVRPLDQFMQLSSENITCNQFLSLNEVCTYTAENATQTHFKQEMDIHAHVWGFSSQIESIGRSNFQKNALGGREIMVNALRLIPFVTTGHIYDPCNPRVAEQKLNETST